MPKAPNPFRTPSPRDQLIELQRELNRLAGTTARIRRNHYALHLACQALDQRLGRSTRLHFLSWAFGRPLTSSRELDDREALGLTLWVRPLPGQPGQWTVNPNVDTLLALWQAELPTREQDLADHG